MLRFPFKMLSLLKGTMQEVVNKVLTLTYLRCRNAQSLTINIKDTYSTSKHSCYIHQNKKVAQLAPLSPTVFALRYQKLTFKVLMLHIF